MVPECHPLTMWQFLRMLGPAAMRQTIQIIGVKWLALVFSILVCVVGGTAFTHPAWISLLIDQPGPLLASAMITFSVCLLIGAHRMHCEEHAHWGGTLKALFAELEDLKETRAKGTPANVTCVRRLMHHFAYVAGQLKRDRELCKEWAVETSRFIEIALVYAKRHQYDSIWSDTLWVGKKPNPNDDVDMLIHRACWLDDTAKELGEHDINPNATEENLNQWLSWTLLRPPQI